MTRGKIVSIVSNLITIKVDGPVAQNEICVVLSGREKLKAEVIRIQKTTAYAQVFESTSGIKVGLDVEFSGKMFEIELGPGILSKNYDGLQNDLDKMEGTFLVTGEETNPLDGDKLNLIDQRTGRKLQERTTIVCNTSNMPVATREASVYVGMTIAEYYRNMGYKVPVLADSTSRWAQSLREISNRLEELAGPDAYPVELTATIANFYSRAGMVELNNGKTGSVTFIGTISPAGGNFKEPVTESTRKVASCFYALSQKRADAKRYPVIDPIQSYSKYLEYDEFRAFTDENIEMGWTKKVSKAMDIIRKGIKARDHIRILGDDAVPPEYHVRYWKRETFDFAFLQQDSFDEIDMNTSLERKQYMLNKILTLCEMEFEFNEFQQVRDFFKKAINFLKQMNYNEFKSSEFQQYEVELNELIAAQKAEVAEI